MGIAYRVVRSPRRTAAIQITAAGEVVVRVPESMSGKAVDRFVQSKQAWISRHIEKTAGNLPKFTKAELTDLTLRAKKVIPGLAGHYGPLVGVSYGSITIRSQRTRWGSCSSKGNLNFNCLLMLTPEDVVRYVVVHELCHRKEMNHSPKFWAEVERILPDYRKSIQWLKENGPALIGRL